MLLKSTLASFFSNSQYTQVMLKVNVKEDGFKNTGRKLGKGGHSSRFQNFLYIYTFS